MKKIFLGVGILAAVMLVAQISFAQEAAVMDSQVIEPADVTVVPSSEEIRSTVTNYINEQSSETGTFDVYDPDAEDIRELTLEKVQENTGKSGEYYYVCASFKDMNSNDSVDLDLDVENVGGKLNVIDVRIHKVNDKERYSYDASGNRILILDPLKVPEPEIVNAPVEENVVEDAQPMEDAPSAEQAAPVNP
ncbi:MAG: hypothetical protein WC676_03930 [Candidatus Omnitrophota bacterium]